MQILIPCHNCSFRKRPLNVCPSCQSHAQLDRDVSAWRLALHANHLARITAEPAREPIAARAPLAPMQVTVTVRHERVDTAPEIASLEPLFETSGPRSFDWDEDRKRLRKSA